MALRTLSNEESVDSLRLVLDATEDFISQRVECCSSPGTVSFN